jgi:hypothetical protein
MTETKMVNYTQQQTLELVEQYNSGTTVEQLAETMGRSTRSIVAKLAREGVYKPKQKIAGERSQTRSELVVLLEVKLNLASGMLSSLEKCDKTQLITLISKI